MVVFESGTEGYHTYRIPSLLVTQRGAMLAFAEGRRSAASDAGDIDLLMRRSTDGGKTWLPKQMVWDDGANTCGNPCPVVDRNSGTIFLLLTWNRGDDTEAKIITGDSRDTRRVYVTKSADDGATWTRPVEITTSVKRTNWTWYATGPGVGIQLERGPYRGRLVVACDHIEGGTKRFGSHVIYSDDHGQTWRLGGVAPRPDVNECEVAELPDGSLLLNMRNYDRSDRTRQQAVSRDGGLTWVGQRHVPELVDPICQASLRRHSWAGASGARGSLLLFANPASTRRERMTVRASLDDGVTWPILRLVDARPSAYSSMGILPDGSVGLLYEVGEQAPYESIVFTQLSMDGLLTGR